MHKTSTLDLLFVGDREPQKRSYGGKTVTGVNGEKKGKTIQRFFVLVEKRFGHPAFSVSRYILDDCVSVVRYRDMLRIAD